MELAILAMIYMLPTIAVLANSKNHSKGKIILFNILVGWTVIGWFIILWLAMGKD